MSTPSQPPWEPLGPAQPRQRPDHGNGMRPATMWARLCAYMVDLLCVLIPTLTLLLVNYPLWLASLPAGGIIIGGTLLRAFTGYTLGGALTGIRAARTNTTQPPGFARQLARTLVTLFLHTTIIGPAISIIFGIGGKDWVDRLCGTWMIAANDITSTPHPTYRPSPTVSNTHLAAEPPAVHTQVRRTPTPWPAPTHAKPTAAHMATTIPQGPLPTPSPQKEHDRAHFVDPMPTVLMPTIVAISGSDGHTASSWSTPRIVPAAHVHHRSSQIPAGRLRLVVDSGQCEEISTPLIVGRNPSNVDPQATIVAIPDSTRTLSRSHFLLRPSGDGVTIEDTYSANGTCVRYPSGEKIPLTPGTKIQIPPGTTILAGERSMLLTSDAAPRH